MALAMAVAVVLTRPATGAGSTVSGRSLGSWAHKAWKGANHGMNVDIHKVVETDQHISDLHANAEIFPPAVEYAFRYLQVQRCAV